MFRGMYYSIRRFLALILGLGLLLAMIGPAQASSPPTLSAPQNGTVVVPPGSPVEIATVMFWGWEATQDHIQAAQMAMDDYGNIKGFALQRNDYDGNCNEVSGEDAANDVVANAQNVGVIGPTCSSSTEGAAPILQTNSVVMISPSNTRPDLPTYGPDIFNRTVIEDPFFEGWQMLAGELATALAWEADFETTHGHYPDGFAKYAYDATTVLLARIDQVSTVDGGGNLVIDRAALAAAVRGTTAFPGVTGSISLDNATGNRIDSLTGAGDRYAATTGDDEGNNCTDPANPCAHVQRAVAMVHDGESTLVAGGTYTENVSIGISLTLEGGYSGPPGWTRDLDLYETILDGSDAQAQVGDWDGRQVRKAAVIYDGLQYKMWFDGVNLLYENQVGYATSGDGLSWTKQGTNPVLSGTPGEWDSTSTEHGPFVLKEGSLYKMWYEGSDGGPRQLGYAYSLNGVDWTKHPGNPVLQAGPESYDQEVAGHGSVLREGGTYKLWYHAMGDQGAIIAYATSPDGLNWTKQGPVLTPDAGGWDDAALWGPSVLNLGGTYWMWYAAAGSMGPPAIGVATSTNGTNWNRPLATPALTETAPIGDPHVIQDGGKLKMWYTNYEQGVIHYAESNDGIVWAQSASNPVLEPGNLGDEGQPVISVGEGVQGVVLDGLTITGGFADRTGGVAIHDAAATIRRCRIRDNAAIAPDDAWAGGAVLGGNPLTIVDSWIVNNQADRGASGVRPGQPLAMTNVVVADNAGAAAIHVNGAMSLMNVTIANNDSDVIFNPEMDETLAMTNSIVYGQAGTELGPTCEGRTCLINYSDIEGGWPAGTGNIDQDPLFLNAAGGNYYLRKGSPCIDAGTPAGAPAADIMGRPRDATPDMGAHEWLGYDIYLPLLLRDFAP